MNVARMEAVAAYLAYEYEQPIGSALVRAREILGLLDVEFADLADDLQKPDPWMNGDDYGEGYVDGKSAAARRIRAVLIGEGPK